MREKVERSNLSSTERSQAISELNEIAGAIVHLPSRVGEQFRAVIPFNDLQVRLLKIHASVARAQGAPPFSVWQKNRWDTLEPTELPASFPPEPPSLRIAMMDNEYRAESFNITNSSDREMRVIVNFEGLPGGRNPGYITVHEVQFVDTRKGIVIADALPVVPRTEAGYEITVYSGMTRQVWLTFHPRDVDPGIHHGTLILRQGIGTEETRLPLTFHLYPIRFPDQPTLSLGMWDYTDEPFAYDITEGNRAAAIENMRAHFVDSPWAKRSTAPRIERGGVDSRGNLRRDLDFSRFDRWVEDWKGVRNYLLFMNAGESFAGKSNGTAAFRRAVSQWAGAWADHNREIGLRPHQVGLLLVDEPRSEAQDRRILEWAAAIKGGTSEIFIWEDPLHRRPWAAKVPEMFEICDVLCPSLSRYADGGKKAIAFYAALQAKGKDLWFYQYRGPARTLDPYYYHRLQQWHCLRRGAVGSGFWSYGDAGGVSPWNEYAIGETSYTPVYLDVDSVTDGKHWEAVREGVEDYEYFIMLRAAVLEMRSLGFEEPLVDRAERLLQDLPAQVAGEFDIDRIDWRVDKDRSLADQARVRVLDLLDALRRRLDDLREEAVPATSARRP